MGKLILSIDQGTTSTTVMVVDSNLRVVAKESQEILPIYPKYGWVEHDLEKIWTGTLKCIEQSVSKIDVKEIAAIGITNQRETVGAWNRITGKPLHNAIVWQCRRTTERTDSLKKDSTLVEKVKKVTGLVIDPYFSGSKIEWLLKNVPEVEKKAKSGEAVFGNIDTYLLHRLSGGASFATDVSNASRTMLMDLCTLDWSQYFLELFGIPLQSLPKILPSAGEFGKTKGMGVLPDGIPICGILGDQQAALFGQLCLESGEAKCTYGTGAFLMCNTGEEIVYSKNGLLTTVAWKMFGKTNYALEGSAFVAGAAVQFLRDNLGIIQSSSEIETLAATVAPEEMGDLVFVPALTGLGAPYWDANAKGMIYGLTRGTQRAHLARAALEGIALQNNDLFFAIAEDIAPKKLKSIKVDGGASANNLLVQLQADLAGISILRPQIVETTALGSALAAGLAAGVWKDQGALKSAWKLEKEFSPLAKENEISFLKKKWKRAIRQVQTN